MSRSDTGPGPGLRLLLSRGGADDPCDEPVLPHGLPVESLRGAPLPALRPLEDGTGAAMLGDAGADASLLRDRRWGLVVPASEPLAQKLLEAVDPLVALRAAQVGLSRAELLAGYVYRAPAEPHLCDDEAAAWYRRVVLEEERPIGERRGELERPDYVLILGDLHQVPEAIQQVLALHGHFVGRLAFSTPAGEPRLGDYRRYCDKVVRAAGRSDDLSREAAAPRRRIRIGYVSDGTEATSLGRELLVEPLLGRLRARERSGAPDELNPLASAALGGADELRHGAAQLDGSVLFTVSHGYGGPRAGWERGEDQRRLQGAMSFVRSRRLTAEDVLAEPAPFVRSGIWLMLACYGAGTPAQSQFYHWLQQTRPDAPGLADEARWVLRSLPGPGARPFIAALPQALLAHEDGPLAFVGHLDLAWSYSFEGGANQADCDHFEVFLRALMRASRIGPALAALQQKRRRAEQALLRGYNQARVALIAGQGADPQDAHVTEPAQLRQWMTRQDLVGYVVLGDPAARLPRPLPEEAARPDPPSVSPPPAAPAPAPEPVAPEPVAPEPVAPEAPPLGEVAPPPARAVPLTLRDLEDAAARQALGQGDTPRPGGAATTAESAEPAELATLLSLYRAAGRAAIAKLLSSTGRAGPLPPRRKPPLF
ncbi:MAG: hypothetical protein U1A78_09570 [Polyangia bacterium]